MSDLVITNTFVDGTIAEAGDVNQNFTDVKTYLNDRNSGAVSWDKILDASVSGVWTNGPATSQTIPSSVETKITGLNSVAWSIGPEFSTSTSTYTVSTSGLYLCVGSIMYNTTEDQKEYRCYVYLNGGIYFVRQGAHSSGTSQLQVQAVGIFNCSPNDTIELYAYHNSSTSIDVLRNTNGSWLAVAKIASL